MLAKIRILLLTVALSVPFTIAQQMSHPMPGSLPKAETRATAALQKIKSLAGPEKAGPGKAEQWEGKDQDGNPAQTSFEVVVAGTAVLETLRESGMEEMLTVYSVDGSGIALVHFCPTNNQPRMRALPGGGDIQQLEFLFRDAGNLPTPTTGHQQKLLLTFEDKDHITEAWTWRSKGKDSVTTIHFTRKGA